MLLFSHAYMVTEVLTLVNTSLVKFARCTVRCLYPRLPIWYNVLMQITTRQEAIDQNLKYYFTGKPCPNGHVSKRKVHNSTCYICAQEARTRRELLGFTWRNKQRQTLLDKFGGKCNRCGLDDPRALQI